MEGLSNIDFDPCGECAHQSGSGVCSNCEADGGYCVECGGTGRCTYCRGTGKVKWEPSPEERAEVEAAGPLTTPVEERGPGGL